MKRLGRTLLHLFNARWLYKILKQEQPPTKQATTQKSDGLRVCIALKDNASFFLLGEAGVAAQAAWYQGAQKVGLSLF